MRKIEKRVKEIVRKLEEFGIIEIKGEENFKEEVVNDVNVVYKLS